ncbi:MAG: hypothetical protein AMS18_06250 [Gemmatimonas sp. SG8_17]|nr:MAG: hypothetical protein AMS18_06250 [Gemmatimonas sp. SG8_17]
MINQEDKLEPVLSGLAELGVAGATIVATRGMAEHLPADTPVLAGLQDLLTRSRPEHTMVLSVIESDATVERAIEMINNVLGNLERAGTGILFTIPVTRALGLAGSPSSGLD